MVWRPITDAPRDAIVSEPERMPAAGLATLAPYAVVATQGHALTVADYALKGTGRPPLPPETAAGRAPGRPVPAARNRAAVITFGKPAANGLTWLTPPGAQFVILARGDPMARRVNGTIDGPA
jgi:hypothetical protein